MGSYGWRSNHSVTDWLYAESYRFDFFQAVKILEATAGSGNWSSVGEGFEPAIEKVRFSSSIRLSFPASDIENIEAPASPQSPTMMEVNLLGIAGHFGPLPPPYTELLIDRLRKKDHAMRSFLDIFNHRLISLLYRSRKNLRVAFALKKPEESRYASYLFSLMGLGTGKLHGRLNLPDRALLRYAGLLAQQPRSISALETILEDYFKLPVKMHSFTGQWFKLEQTQITKIGSAPPDGRNNKLGHSAVLGNKVWDQQTRFEIHIGPLNRQQFITLLPTGNQFGPLLSLAEFFAGQEYDFDIYLEIEKEAMPSAAFNDRTRLGWNSWLGTTQNQTEKVKISPRSLARLFVNLMWHNDFGLDMAIEKIPPTMLRKAR
jgi:type VI secretion system protein ImpH